MGTIDADGQAIADRTREQGEISAGSTPEVENTLTRPCVQQLGLPGRRSGPLAGHPLHQCIGLTGPIDIVEGPHLYVRHAGTVGPAKSRHTGVMDRSGAGADRGRARYDGLAAWYDTVARPSAEFSRQDLVRLLGGGAGLCLDLGCGTGLYGDILTGTGRAVVGVDVSQDQLKVAKAREVVAAADASQLPFCSGSFDDVACIWVHGDLDDLTLVLAEVARVLRPGGRLLLFGVHPCFNGPCVEGRDDGGRIVHPTYRQSGWHRDAPWWSDNGIRQAVGVRHRTLAELLNDVLSSPLRLLRVEEPRDDPVPAVLALVAERPAGPE